MSDPVNGILTVICGCIIGICGFLIIRLLDRINGDIACNKSDLENHRKENREDFQRVYDRIGELK